MRARPVSDMMNICDAKIRPCTDIVPLYRDENKHLEPVNWDIVPQIYGFNYTLGKLVHQANIELELVFTKLELKYAPLKNYEWLLDRIDEINRSWDICAMPPGGVAHKEVICAENGNKYFTVRFGHYGI